MEMEMPNTKTPWQVNSRDPSQVCDADGEVRGCAPIATMHGTAAEKRANAKFIVRACNSHDALVTALSEQSEFMKWLESVGKREVNATYSEIHAEAHRRSAAVSAALAATV